MGNNMVIILGIIIVVQMTSSQVIVEMVVDGGGHFSPASYRWFTHMSLLFSSYTDIAVPIYLDHL